MATSLESISDDSLLHVLQYASPAASARLGITSKRWGEKILGDGRLWEAFAADRWGSGVAVGNYGEDHDEDRDEGEEGADSSAWYRYYRHRCSSWRCPIAETSHLDLIQEYYASDPYRLLTACILCSRTSGGPLIRSVVQCFLEKYNTPTAVVNADVSVMGKELHSLGLKRENIMKRFVAGFLGDWTDVTELYGCGAFASSSFDVFCNGDYKKVLTDKGADRNVKAYAAYLKGVCEGTTDEKEGKSLESKSKAAKKARKRPPPRQRRSLPTRKMTRNRK